MKICTQHDLKNACSFNCASQVKKGRQRPSKKEFENLFFIKFNKQNIQINDAVYTKKISINFLNKLTTINVVFPINLTLYTENFVQFPDRTFRIPALEYKGVE